MAPTSLLGQKTSSSPLGREARAAGYPVPMTEMLAILPGVAYAARGTLIDAASIGKTKQMLKRACEVQLQGAGFAVGRQDVDSSQPKDTVIDQDPRGGASLTRGGTVTLFVSKGPKQTTIPDVTSQDQASATQALEQSGFSVDVQQQDTTDPAQDGIVLSQDPPGLTKAKPGTTVTIVVGHLVAIP